MKCKLCHVEVNYFNGLESHLISLDGNKQNSVVCTKCYNLFNHKTNEENEQLLQQASIAFFSEPNMYLVETSIVF